MGNEKWSLDPAVRLGSDLEWEVGLDPRGGAHLLGSWGILDILGILPSTQATTNLSFSAAQQQSPYLCWTQAARSNTNLDCAAHSYAEKSSIQRTSHILFASISGFL